MKKTLTKLIFLFATLLLPQLTFAQAGLVKGQVVDKEGNPLPGVSVLQLGSTNGTITSIDGKYAISNLNEIAKTDLEKTIVLCSSWYISKE